MKSFPPEKKGVVDLCIWADHLIPIFDWVCLFVSLCIIIAIDDKVSIFFPGISSLIRELTITETLSLYRGIYMLRSVWICCEQSFLLVFVIVCFLAQIVDQEWFFRLEATALVFDALRLVIFGAMAI